MGVGVGVGVGGGNYDETDYNDSDDDKLYCSASAASDRLSQTLNNLGLLKADAQMVALQKWASSSDNSDEND
jgi:hypothetical protein